MNWAGERCAERYGRSAMRPLLLPADDESLCLAAELLRRGGLVALPTETVYGLAADARSVAAVNRIFAAKGRPSDHPVIVHIADRGQLHEWAVDVPTWINALLEQCWPGPLTVVLRRAPGVLDEVTGGLATVGLRAPAHPVIQQVLRQFGGGLAAPSANRFGRVSPTTAQHVMADLADHLKPDCDAIIDGGPCAVGLESTIVDCTSDVPSILRPGAITAERIEELVQRPVQRVITGPSRAPGMLSAHYAPSAQVEVVQVDDVARRVDAHRGSRVGVLCATELPLPPGVIRLDAPHLYTAEGLSPILYARLHDADRLGLDVLLVVAPDEVGMGVAVLDRLRRAATGSKRTG